MPSDHPDPADILQIRNGIVCFYAVRHGGALTLIDTGFFGGLRALRRALARRGWDGLPISNILLTHGHLDHAYNAAPIAQLHGAAISAPAPDRHLLRGDFSGTPSWGAGGDVLQRTVAKATGYHPPENVRFFDPATQPGFAGGFTCVHLPGHTAGHCGFQLGDILFCGDLFASFGPGPLHHPPPAIFNADGDGVRHSLHHAATLPLSGALPGHADHATPATHLARLRALAKKIR